jgi:hypothetical protein
MEFERMMAELFADEDRARGMARHLMELSQRDKAAAAREKKSLLEFLRGPMEVHMQYEERVIFPLLVAHELGPEVEVALKHHASIREEADHLEKAETVEGISQAVFFAARIMLHHTNFEGDYIYPELSKEEWRALMRETANKK